MTVKIIPNNTGRKIGKLADVELYFTDGHLEGLKLIGFTVWAGHGTSPHRVTFPCRQYSVMGELRSFALLRPTKDDSDREKLSNVILAAYREYVHRHGAAEGSIVIEDGSVDADGFRWAPSTAPARD